MFNYKKPTVQLLGRWQPWHGGHTALFEKAWDITNQVVIMVRDVQGIDAGMGNNDNPFDFKKIEENITAELFMHGYMVDEDFKIILVPNIVDISYGRGVGYTFTEHDLGKEIHSISATKIRKEMRDNGELD
tara:strand:+ start:672 stop:1064 length:393 start_codon:yes stop_codon:yes gene_type:complete